MRKDCFYLKEEATFKRDRSFNVYTTELVQSFKLKAHTIFVDDDIGEQKQIFKDSLGVGDGGNVGDYKADVMRLDFSQFKQDAKYIKDNVDSVDGKVLDPDWLSKHIIDFKTKPKGTVKSMCVYKLIDISLDFPLIAGQLKDLIARKGNFF